MKKILFLTTLLLLLLLSITVNAEVKTDGVIFKDIVFNSTGTVLTSWNSVGNAGGEATLVFKVMNKDKDVLNIYTTHLNAPPSSEVWYVPYAIYEGYEDEVYYVELFVFDSLANITPKNDKVSECVFEVFSIDYSNLEEQFVPANTQVESKDCNNKTYSISCKSDIQMTGESIIVPPKGDGFLFLKNSFPISATRFDVQNKSYKAVIEVNAVDEGTWTGSDRLGVESVINKQFYTSSGLLTTSVGNYNGYPILGTDTTSQIELPINFTNIELTEGGFQEVYIASLSFVNMSNSPIEIKSIKLLRDFYDK